MDSAPSSALSRLAAQKLIRRASGEELFDIKRFYQLTVDNEKYQKIVTGNRRSKEAIERKMVDLGIRSIIGEDGSNMYVASLVEEKLGALTNDIKKELMNAGYTEDQVTQISAIYRMQRNVLRLKVSCVSVTEGGFEST
ncbi:uncharacterized protein SPPG_05094 [Spizellomyces punctatus DAOM BR117]|uniref:Uncharacterized protein n=1 Tax=Spizellomyces punctatus (strain DAOM BR117) TaxID=645134 RepID=A0A0L0HF29_SPIPD|nr:uncharacterized protein SPPG_05086 [Spizellomyces punctatus DAOM BR117]XP_016607752.1 uncharacterized protein SPPG_05094 [Spizellomyces punctatus DAOM BR117]KNC99705.1 hypothetical protein SPPG_05086 [Spizellomyces punctatus DAOM BR117]KNC99712.1 hypothetical protein SPPG_05094 [Spizellomyces punctatus DAOM BR117]|eukprot:XP_016607745.1 hypothetical protein SPPG_05086 [Spizellomyces punctatus DAOM BR117]